MISMEKINDFELAELMGIMIGDGHISFVRRQYFISISGNLKDEKIFFESVIIPILSKLRYKKVVFKTFAKYGKIEINFSDKYLFYFFKSLGYPEGRKSHRIIIPDNFYNSKLSRFVVAGIFATDGCLTITDNNGTIYPRIEFKSKSIRLLKQIKSILDDFGMEGGLYTRFGRLQYNGKNQLDIFLRNIGFINPKHKEKYNKWAESQNVGVAQLGRAPVGTLVPGDSHKISYEI